MAVAGVQLDDPALTAGLRYLREKVSSTPAGAQPHNQTRGGMARYAAYGLLGLTAYPEAIDEPGHVAAIESCVRWLAGHVLAERVDQAEIGVGWAEHPSVRYVSLLSTSVAAYALARVPGSVDVALEAAELAASARRRIRRLARGDSTGRWWPQRADDDADSEDAASPALTSLAVLALAEGGARQSLRFARSGVAWLLDHHDRWEQDRDRDVNVIDANWVHVTFALGLRAALIPAAGIDPQDARLSIAISFLDQLWSPKQNLWLHGHPNAYASTSASFNAVMAIQRLRQAWRGFDPIENILHGRPPKPSPPGLGAALPSKIVWSDNTITVYGADNTMLANRRFRKNAKAMSKLIAVLAAPLADERRTAPQTERSFTGHELAELTGITEVPEYIRRLNAHILDAAKRDSGRPCLLVGRVESGGSVMEDSYLLLGESAVVDG